MNIGRKWAIGIALLVVGGIGGWVEYWGTRPAIPVLTINTLAVSLNAGARTNLTIPNSILQYDGKMVSVVGDIWAPKAEDNHLYEFQLTDNSHFHSFMPRPPLAQEFVNVKIKPGVEGAYSDLPVRVTGGLHVKVETDQNGVIMSVYRLDGERVEPFTAAAENWLDIKILQYLWIMIVGVVVLVLLIWVALGRRRFSAGGFCAQCGYDLRGTPERCPECGTVPLVSRREWKRVMGQFEGEKPAGGKEAAGN